MAKKYLVLFALQITLGYAQGRPQEQPAPTTWNIQASVFSAHPEKILGSNFRVDSCVPEASFCMLSSTTNLITITVSAGDLIDLKSNKEKLIKDGGYEVKEESGLGEGAFMATKSGGNIIEIVAPKGKRSLSVRFVYVKNSSLGELRAFASRLLDNF